MSWIGRPFLRLARWIAGRERSEWIDAMEAESASLGGDGTEWAIGCAIASLKDRVWRDRMFLAALLLLPLGAVLLEFALFFPVVWLSRSLGLPNWTFIVAMACAPLPFAYLLGRFRPGLTAYVATPICFAIFTAIPWIIHWKQFGTPIFSWLGNDATIYMMPPWAGLSCGLLIWLSGVWLGARRARASQL